MSFDLDHVAIASRDITKVLNTLVGDLGARVIFGGFNIGFRAMQVDAGDLRIELLEPHNIEANDFLERFLTRSGEGPHHLTFKTDNIERELERATQAGYTPVGVNIDNQFWREAFLHPKESLGTVVQIAQSAFPEGGFPEDADMSAMRWWPEPPSPAAERATLQRVVVVSDEMSKALDLYSGYLQGSTVDQGEGWVDLGWPGGGRIRLEHAGGRTAGIDRLEWTGQGSAREFVVAGTRFSVYA